MEVSGNRHNRVEEVGLQAVQCNELAWFSFPKKNISPDSEADNKRDDMFLCSTRKKRKFR